MFKKRDNIKEVEEGKYLAPKFDENGLIPVITTDFETGDILSQPMISTLPAARTSLCTPDFLVSRAIGNEDWRARRDSNPEPPGSKPGALSS